MPERGASPRLDNFHIPVVKQTSRSPAKAELLSVRFRPGIPFYAGSGAGASADGVGTRAIGVQGSRERAE